MGAHQNYRAEIPACWTNAESWTEMGISHEYHSAPRRRARGASAASCGWRGSVVAILLVAYAVTAILEKGTVGKSTPDRRRRHCTEHSGTAAHAGRGGFRQRQCCTADSSGTAQAVQLESFGPARQTDGAYTIKAYDASVIRQPGLRSGRPELFFGRRLSGRQPDGGLLGLSDQSERRAHLRLYGWWGRTPSSTAPPSKAPPAGRR